MSLDLEHNAWPSDSAATVISIDAEVIISRTGSYALRGPLLPLQGLVLQDPPRAGFLCTGPRPRGRGLLRLAAIERTVIIGSPL